MDALFLIRDTQFPFFHFVVPGCSSSTRCREGLCFWMLDPTSLEVATDMLPDVARCCRCFQFSRFVALQISYHRFVTGLSMFSTHKAAKDEHQALADTGTRLECIAHSDTHTHMHNHAHIATLLFSCGRSNI